MAESNYSENLLEENISDPNPIDNIEGNDSESNLDEYLMRQPSTDTIHTNFQISEIHSRVITNTGSENILLANHSIENILDDSDIGGVGENLSVILSESTAIRLFNSIRRRSSTGLSMVRQQSSYGSTLTNVSWLSLEQGDTCRICRHKRNDTELIECPCRCTGTMGHIHRKCLQRWIRFRNNHFCEICKENFNFTLENKNYYRLFTSFFQPQYFGTCAISIVNLVALTPLVYFTMNQLITTMESLNDKDMLKVILIGPGMLLASSIYFFFFFEWALCSLFRVKNILIHWWNFGDQDDEDYTIPERDSDEGFFEI